MNGERWAFICYTCDPVRRVFLMSAPETKNNIPHCPQHGKMDRQPNRPYRPSQVRSQRVPKNIPGQDGQLDQDGQDRRVPEVEDGQRSPAIERAVAFLVSELDAGPRLATEIKTHASANEISLKTLLRAKAELGVGVAKTGEGPWQWSM